MKARIPKNAKNITNNYNKEKTTSLISGEEMSNEEFWKRLDRITEKPQDFDTTMEFLELLAKGYSQELQILVMGVKNTKDEDLFRQNCILDNGEKTMLFFTDYRHEEACRKIMMTPVGSTFEPECFPAYICEVINNAVEKEEVKAIAFNYGSDNQYIIPKLMLPLALMKYADLPLIDDE